MSYLLLRMGEFIAVGSDDGGVHEPHIHRYMITHGVADDARKLVVDSDETVQAVGEERGHSKKVEAEGDLLDPLARCRWAMGSAAN